MSQNDNPFGALKSLVEKGQIQTKAYVPAANGKKPSAAALRYADTSVKKAFEDAVGHEVIVDKNGHLMGAFGVAVLAKNSGIEKDFSFDVADIKFRTTGFDCPKCANHCEIVCVFKDDKLIDSWGNKCDNGAVKIN